MSFLLMDSLPLHTGIIPITAIPVLVGVDDIYTIRQTSDEFVDGAPKPVFIVTFKDGERMRCIGRVRDFASKLNKHRHVIDGIYKGNI